MLAIEWLGYLGAVLMFSTFYMKTMIPLRVVGICANVCMIGYTAVKGVYPVLVLQALLLPLNTMRLVQMRRLIDRVKKAARGDFRVDALIPFMKPVHAKKGTVLFRVGEPADKMFLVQSGVVRLESLEKEVRAGDLLGEIGVLAPNNKRTDTAVCSEDAELYTITQSQVMQLYFQNPEFGFFLIRLVTKRLVGNLAEAALETAPTLSPGPRPA
jgi:CRP/FNR family transcriptional regulator, cyclic AMP receptor protein